MKLDVERTQALLEIVEKCAGHTGKLGSISSAALGELMEMNEALRISSMKASKPVIADKPKVTPISPVSDETPTTETLSSETATITDRRV